MFDSEKIAKQALRRAGELEAEENRRRTLRKTVSLVGSCAACVVITLLSLLLCNPSDDHISISDKPIPLANSPFQQADENAKPYTGAEQIVIIPDIGNTVTAANDTELTMLLHNPEGNTYNFIFKIVLTETEETIFESGLVRPGMCIENPTLSTSIAKGEYNALVKIIFGLEESILPGSVDIAIVIIFE